MPWYGFIHPVLAILTLIYGLNIGKVSLSRLGEWDFPLRRVRRRTFIFALLTILNLGLGLLVNTVLAGRGQRVELVAHLPLAILVSASALLATLVTFSKGPLGELPPRMRWHPILITIGLALIMTMGFIALLKIFRL